MIVTLAGGTVVVGSGAKLTDSATLSGGLNPTGTITFTLYQSRQHGGRHRDSRGQRQRHLQHAHRLSYPRATGTYLWSASYRGDSTTTRATDNGQNENETVSPASPTISTLAGGTVVVGSGAKLTDSATLPAASSDRHDHLHARPIPATRSWTPRQSRSTATAPTARPPATYPRRPAPICGSPPTAATSTTTASPDNGQNEPETVSPASPTISHASPAGRWWSAAAPS